MDCDQLACIFISKNLLTEVICKTKLGEVVSDFIIRCLKHRLYCQCCVRLTSTISTLDPQRSRVLAGQHCMHGFQQFYKCVMWIEAIPAYCTLFYKVFCNRCVVFRINVKIIPIQFFIISHVCHSLSQNSVSTS